MANKKED